MFTDAAFAPENLIEYSFAEPPCQRDNPGFQLDPSIHFRHARRANVAWVDGHVDHRQIEHTRGSIYGGTHEQMDFVGIGWFGPTDNTFFDLK